MTPRFGSPHVTHDAEAEGVQFDGDVAPEGLGRHVGRGAEHGAGQQGGGAAAGAHLASQTEVAHLPGWRAELSLFKPLVSGFAYLSFSNALIWCCTNLKISKKI